MPKILPLPGPCAVAQKKYNNFMQSPFVTSLNDVLPHWALMQEHCHGSFNWESKLRDDTRELEATNKAYAEAGERFLAEHYFAPCVASHTDQIRYFDEHRGNERWVGIEIGAQKIRMMHAGAKALGFTPYTAIGCDIPIPNSSAVFYVGLKNAIEQGWKLVLVSLPEWRGEKSQEEVFETFVKSFTGAGFDLNDIAGYLPHPND